MRLARARPSMKCREMNPGKTAIVGNITQVLRALNEVPGNESRQNPGPQTISTEAQPLNEVPGNESRQTGRVAAGGSMLSSPQ